MDSLTDPMNPNQVGDDSADAEIAGEQRYVKMSEGGETPPAGSLDTADPAIGPTEDPRSDPDLDNDPGQLPGSRDPDLADSLENDHRPEDRGGDTPYDAQGAMGSEGK